MESLVCLVRLLIAAVVAISVALPIHADQILEQDNIDFPNRGRLRGGPAVGRDHDGKYIAIPDLLQLLRSGSINDLSAMSVRPRDALPALALAQVADGLALNIAWFVQQGDNGDWALACQRAVNAVLALPRGGEVHHSRGSFTYKTQCRIPKTVDKSLTFSAEGQGTVLRDNGQRQAIIYAGSTQNGLGGRVEFKNFMIQGVDGLTSRGLELQWANGALVSGVTFRDLYEGVTLINSFAVTFEKCQDFYVRGAVIHATTLAHKLTLNDHLSNSTTAPLLKIDHASDAISINDIDAEGSGKLIQMPGGANLRVTGGYVEFMTQQLFDFTGGMMVNANIDLDWMALGTGNGAVQTFANMRGGIVKTGTSHNQGINFDEATVTGVDAHDRYFNLTGTSNLSNLPTRWRSPTLADGWNQRPNYSVTRYRKDENNDLFFEGEMHGGSNGAVIFTLPIGFRPLAIMNFTTQTANGLSWVQVNPDGRVICVTAAEGQYAALNGIRYTASQ